MKKLIMVIALLVIACGEYKPPPPEILKVGVFDHVEYISGYHYGGTVIYFDDSSTFVIHRRLQNIEFQTGDSIRIIGWDMQTNSPKTKAEKIEEYIYKADVPGLDTGYTKAILYIVKENLGGDIETNNSGSQ